jgi:hypothetical protein
MNKAENSAVPVPGNSGKNTGIGKSKCIIFQQINAAEYAHFALDLKCFSGLNCGRLGSIRETISAVPISERLQP